MQETTGPKALTEYLLKITKNKENKPYLKLIIQGILAGSYIAIGAIGYFKLAGSIADPGLAAFLRLWFSLLVLLQYCRCKQNFSPAIA